jgi:geranylgeranyl reductase family protein
MALQLRRQGGQYDHVMTATSVEGDLRPAPPSTYECDVLVIGGGPSGSATAYWLAQAGVNVLVVEKKHFPRNKTCGDGLTPRSVRQLYDMGLREDLHGHHRFEGLRALAFGRELELAWPSHEEYPDHGYVITRSELDAMVANHAEKAGAVYWQGTEAIGPLGANAGDGGEALGATVTSSDHGTTSEIRARIIVVADGANSRFGRALGAARDRSIPLGMAIRGYYASPRHDERFIESRLDIRDSDGNIMPGYGWIFPLGDGRVNVGVGLLSTFDRWKSVNTTKLMEAFVQQAPASWGLSAETALGAPTGGRLPMGLSVGPRVGPDYLLVGDAGGSINPFNGEGIAYAYETGRLASKHIVRALTNNNRRLLANYESELQSLYADYYKVASAFMKLVGRPSVMRALVGTGMRSKVAMTVVLRIMTNLLRDKRRRVPELAFAAASSLLKVSERTTGAADTKD